MQPRQIPLFDELADASLSPSQARALDDIPDVRDGLTRKERILLRVLHDTQRERGGRAVPTAMLYGRVVEHVDLSIDEFQRILSRLIGQR